MSDSFKELNEEINKINQLWEMANLPKKRTGLPVVVYISGNKASHEPRIEFFDSYADVVGNNYDLLIPLTVDKEPEIPIEHKLHIKTKDLNKVKEWVKLNYDVLMTLYSGDIDEIDAGLQQQKYQD